MLQHLKAHVMDPALKANYNYSEGPEASLGGLWPFPRSAPAMRLDQAIGSVPMTPDYRCDRHRRIFEAKERMIWLDVACLSGLHHSSLTCSNIQSSPNLFF